TYSRSSSSHWPLLIAPMGSPAHSTSHGELFENDARVSISHQGVLIWIHFQVPAVACRVADEEYLGAAIQTTIAFTRIKEIQRLGPPAVSRRRELLRLGFDCGLNLWLDSGGRSVIEAYS